MRRQIVGLVVAAAYLLVPPGGLAADRLVPSKYPTIQAAIDAAVDGDTVIIAPGTYTGDGNRDIDFKGKAITVRSTDPNDLSIVAATVIDCQGSPAEPHRGFYFHSKEDSDSVLAALTISNGCAEKGGGIWCGSSPTIRRCLISQNLVCGGRPHGGGVYLSGGSATIERCRILDNSSEGDFFQRGGGLYCYGGHPTIVVCTIEDNWVLGAYSEGGAVYCRGGTPRIVNCTIRFNSVAGSYAHGGGIHSYESSAVITGCIISANSAEGNYALGGGISCEGAGTTIANCTICGNNGQRGSAFNAGGIKISSGTDVFNCIIRDNLHENVSGYTDGVRYSNMGSRYSVKGEGNIDVIPGFVQPGYWDDKGTGDFSDDVWHEGDYHLLPGSPCIDSGNPDHIPLPGETDIDGEPRVMGDRVDMGVDEFTDVPIPIIGLSEGQFDFVGDEGYGNLAPQKLLIWNAGSGRLNWSVSENCPWLEVSPIEGQADTETDEVTLRANISGLAAGEYDCYLYVSASWGWASNSPQRVSIHLVVNGPEIELSQDEFHFEALEAGANPAPQIFTIDNIAGGTLFWEAIPDCKWVRVDPNSGMSRIEEDEVVLSVDVGGLAFGNYDCEVTVSDPDAQNSPQMIDVTLLVVGPIIELPVGQVDLYAYEGELERPTQILRISNVGGGVLNWRIEHNGAWLHIQQEAGSIPAGEEAEVVLTATPQGLGVGRYDCQLVISSDHAENSPQVVSATLFVRATEVGLGLNVPSDYPTIQAAVDAAGQGDQIVVAPGRYTGEGNRDIDLKGKAITVRGTDPNDPNIVEATVIDCNGTQDEPHRGFYLKECVGAKISGLTITNGCAASGGATYLEDTEAVIKRCRIVDNKTRAGENSPRDPDVCEWGCDAGDGGSGGGLYCRSSSVSVEDCQISHNAAGDGGRGFMGNRAGAGGAGGGLCCRDSRLFVKGCRISENDAGDGGNCMTFGGGNGGGGGGIFVAGTSSLVVSHSKVSRNTAGRGGQGDDMGSGVGGSGGGIYCDATSSLQVGGCDVLDNVTGSAGEGTDLRYGRGGSGGGIYCVSQSVLRIRESNIAGNATLAGARGEHWERAHSGHGGGIYCSSAVITDTSIRDNSTGEGGSSPSETGGDGGDGGGIYCVDSLELIDCTIRGNRTGSGGESNWAGGDGGNGGGVWADSLVARQCWIAENRTGDGEDEMATHSGHTGGGSGGGLYCKSGAISECVIVNNATGKSGLYDGHGGHGGGAYCGSGTISNCLILGNRTGNGRGGAWEVVNPGGGGAGVYFEVGSESAISDCTVVGNITGYSEWFGREEGKGNGGGISADEGVVITDSIIWGNEPEQLYGVDCNSVSFCDIGGEECSGGVGNICADPLFVVGPLGDYYLSQTAAGQAVGSPCVDAGSDLAVNLGLDRFTTRTDHATDAGIVDMGYHYPAPCLADIDGDGAVDMNDYAILAAHWAKAAMKEIPKGDVVVDGDLSEWDEADNWIALDKVYYGNPADVSEAKYALRWSPDTDKIYAAVIVYNSNHWFSDEYVKWDASDRIEIYCQGNPEGGTGWLRVYDIAQQYMLAPDTSGGSWATWAFGEHIGEDAGLEYAVVVDGDRIIHEAGVLMFDNYGGFTGGDTVVTDLEPGHVVGFDLLVNTRWAEDGFGMLSENLMTGKSGDAGQFARYLLVERIALAGPDTGAADLNGDGRVDWPDVALLADDWLWPPKIVVP